jgi:hypothetical protein
LESCASCAPGGAARAISPDLDESSISESPQSHVKGPYPYLFFSRVIFLVDLENDNDTLICMRTMYAKNMQHAA